MSAVVVHDSDVESERFGLRIGRVLVDDDVDVAELESACAGFDVVVMRCRAEAIDLPFRLLALRDLCAFTADHLSVWRWDVAEIPMVPLTEGWTVAPSTDTEVVEEVVRDTFADYRNHYRANPLFEPQAALDGYVDWALSVLGRSDDACTLLRDETGEAVGVALVDWDEDVPDVELAGIRPRAQGQGRYGALMTAVMRLTNDRSRPALTISTQSHNVNVMRAWARLGFLPVDTLTTTHLVRRSLLDERPPHAVE